MSTRDTHKEETVDLTPLRKSPLLQPPCTLLLPQREGLRHEERSETVAHQRDRERRLACTPDRYGSSVVEEGPGGTRRNGDSRGSSVERHLPKRTYG